MLLTIQKPGRQVKCSEYVITNSSIRNGEPLPPVLWATALFTILTFYEKAIGMNEMTAMEGVLLIGIGIRTMLVSQKARAGSFAEAGAKRPSLV